MFNWDARDVYGKGKFFGVGGGVCLLDPPVASVLAEHMTYIRDKIGADHVGIGADYDGVPLYVFTHHVVQLRWSRVLRDCITRLEGNELAHMCHIILVST